MNFAVNYLAVIVAAIVGIVFAGLWYAVIIMKPNQVARREDKQIGGIDPPPTLLSYSFVGNLLAAVAMAVVLKSIGAVTLVNGLMLGAAIGVGIVLPAIAQVHLYGFRPRAFIWMDAGEWIIALMLMGAIIGAFG